MKTSPRSCSLIFDIALAFTLLTGIVFASTTEPQTTPLPSEPKDHVLFVGTDLDVKQDGRFYRVVGATKDSLEIDKDHNRERLSLGRGASLRVSKGVKLSNTSATISDVRTESVNRASARAQLEAMQAMSTMTDMAEDGQDSLQAGVLRADQMTSINPDATFSPEATRAWIASVRGGARDAFSDGIPDLQRMADEGSTHLRESLARGGETEVELSFKLSSPVPIEHPYLIVVATYASDDKPNQIARQVSARTFDHLDRHARSVTMSHAASVNGLPFKKFDVALFAGGEEVATNLSEKRMPLTSDEAYQFFLIDYLSNHKGTTLPPAAVLMTPRVEFRQQIGNADTHQAIYVTVDKTGKVLAMSADKAGAEKLPVSVDSALQSVRFMPALKNGAPVEGHVKVTLAELAR